MPAHRIAAAAMSAQAKSILIFVRIVMVSVRVSHRVKWAGRRQARKNPPLSPLARRPAPIAARNAAATSNSFTVRKNDAHFFPPQSDGVCRLIVDVIIVVVAVRRRGRLGGRLYRPSRQAVVGMRPAIP